jgi:chlorophyllide a reductase subunit X
MTRTLAILGKGGVGKTFVAAHVAMSLGYMGLKTLLVGCDQKRDTLRALSGEERTPLIHALDAVGYAYDELALADLIAPASAYVDLMELGPSPLLVGHYGNVLDEAFHTFDLHQLWENYTHVVFDLGEERFDAESAPLFRRVEQAIAVTDDAVESLFVLNRLLRAALIGANEYQTRLRLLGVIHNRSQEPVAFQRYVERTRLFPLLTVPDLPELARLRRFHRTAITLEREPPHLKPVVDGFIRIADMLRVQPLVLNPVTPLPDEEIWKLAPPVSLPS